MLAVGPIVHCCYGTYYDTKNKRITGLKLYYTLLHQGQTEISTSITHYKCNVGSLMIQSLKDLIDKYIHRVRRLMDSITTMFGVHFTHIAI